MAKGKTNKINNTDKDDDLFSLIAKETDGNVLSEIEEAPYFIDTGSLSINYILSGKFIKGGIPGKKITEVYGPSASGKSFIASNVLHGTQKIGGIPVILDCENATNADFMSKTSHVNLNRVLRYTPMSLEQAFSKIHNVTRKIREHKGKDVPVVFVYDSISVSPCERELKETKLPENYNAAMWKKLVGRKEQPGERARICGNELRKLQSVLDKENITILFINQLRDKIGVMYGPNETTAGGGRGLPFYAACRFRTSTQKKIDNKRLGTFAGVNMKVANTKNRSCRPFIMSEGIQLYFDTGVNPIAGLLSLLIQEERIVGKKGNWTVLPAFLPEGKEEYKFKAATGRNEVPLQVLFDCPGLVDAKDRAELEEYLSPFMKAVTNASCDDFKEKAIAFDDEGNPLDDDEDLTSELEEMEEDEEEAEAE